MGNSSDLEQSLNSPCWLTAQVPIQNQLLTHFLQIKKIQIQTKNISAQIYKPKPTLIQKKQQKSQVTRFTMDDDKNIDKNAANYSRFLPIANIGRIMKKSLPQNAKIAKDAKETVQECVSEFISFITSEACEKCKNEKRKTINGEDILSSIQVLGFEGYGEILKLYLNKYRESVKATGGDVDLGVLGKEENQSDSDEDDDDDMDQDQGDQN